MSIPVNNVTIGGITKKSEYDSLYNNALLADTGGTPGGAQTIPGAKTFSGDLTVGATPTLFVDVSENRVGVGTAAPIVPFHLVGTSVVTPDANYTVLNYDNRAQAAGVGGGIGFGGKYTDAGTYTTWAGIWSEKENGVSGEFGGELAFWTRPNGGGFVERMRIDAAGNVGIGTASPDAKLHILDVTGANIILNSNTGSVKSGIYMTEGSDSTPLLSGVYVYYDGVNNVFGIDIGVDPLVNAVTINRFTRNVGIDTILPTVKFSVSEKAGMSTIGGHLVKLTNKTGSPTVAGQLVLASTGTDDAFATCGANSDACIGIVLAAGIADGAEAWIVTGGVADVLIDSGGCTHGDRMIASATAGSADVWNTGGAVATHFTEIGHCNETRVGAGFARCMIHLL